MIIGIGTDIADFKRIRRIFNNNPDRFIKRIFSEEEIAYCSARKDPVPSFAARFAAKEAFSKSFDLGWGSGISWRDVAVVNSPNGKPEFLFRNKALDLTAGKRLWLSLSHTDEYAVAMVIAEEI